MGEDVADLVRRLEVLEAREAIRDLKYRYFRGCDHQRPDEVAACFAPGAVVIDYQEFPRFETREAFAEIFGAMGCVPEIVDMHHGQNPVITLTGPDGAEGVWDMFYFNMNLAARTAIQLAGEYRDVYVRRHGAWLMTSTVFRRSSVMTWAIGEDGAVVCSGLGRGATRRPQEAWAA